MSVELPEALILAEQMNDELKGKRVAACQLRDTDRMQRIGFINKDLTDFDPLVGGGIESTVSRGNTILVKLDNGMNLIITPEYGGRVFYHSGADAAPEKYHLRVDFTDGAALTVRLASMGVIRAAGDSELGASYVYRRDFSEKASPVEEEFTLKIPQLPGPMHPGQSDLGPFSESLPDPGIVQEPQRDRITVILQCAPEDGSTGDFHFHGEIHIRPSSNLKDLRLQVFSVACSAGFQRLARSYLILPSAMNRFRLRSMPSSSHCKPAGTNFWRIQLRSRSAIKTSK